MHNNGVVRAAGKPRVPSCNLQLVLTVVVGRLSLEGDDNKDYHFDQEVE